MMHIETKLRENRTETALLPYNRLERHTLYKVHLGDEADPLHLKRATVCLWSLPSGGVGLLKLHDPDLPADVLKIQNPSGAYEQYYRFEKLPKGASTTLTLTQI